MNKIEQFTKKDGTWFLSNMYPVDIEYDGLVYQTAEACFQAQKFKPEERIKFTNLDVGDDNRADALGRMAKKLGGKNGIRLLSKTEQMSWNYRRLTVMEDVVREKFLQHPDLKEKLLATKDAELIEGRNFRPDYFWGKKLSTNEGENHLGIILMKIRKELLDNKKS